MISQTKKHIIFFTVLRIVGCLLTSAGLIIWLICLDLHWNFFNLDLVFDLDAFGYLFLCVLTLIVMGITARHTTDRVSQVFSLIICLAMIVIAIQSLNPEPLSPDTFLGRNIVSPLWYRAIRFFILLIPCFFWIIWPLKFWRKNKSK